MPVMNSLAGAFADFGARAANPRWGWAAMSEDGKTIVLTLWADTIRRDGESVIYDVRARGDLDAWRDRHGNRDRLRKLIQARDHCKGLFRAVHVEAVDTKSGTRRTRKRYEADDRLVMHLIDLDETTGEFLARSVD